MNGDFDKFAARAAPAIFVLLWSTGFIGTKYVINNADPLTYLAIRMALVVGLDGCYRRLCAAGMAQPHRSRPQHHRRHSGARLLSRRHGGGDLALDPGGPVGADPRPAADPHLDHRQPLVRGARHAAAMVRPVDRACGRRPDPARPADDAGRRAGAGLPPPSRWSASPWGRCTSGAIATGSTGAAATSCNMPR